MHGVKVRLRFQLHGSVAGTVKVTLPVRVTVKVGLQWGVRSSSARASAGNPTLHATLTWTAALALSTLPWTQPYPGQQP